MMATALTACVFSRADCELIIDRGHRTTGVGDVGDPPSPQVAGGEARVSRVGVEHGELVGRRAGVGGGTRACGFAGARGARLCTVVLCTPWMYVEVRMYSVDCIACFRIRDVYIWKNIRETEQ